MSLQRAFAAGASLFILACGGAANAQSVATTQTPIQDPREARIAALEARLAEIQDQLSDLKAGAAADTAEVRRVQQEAPALDLKNGRPTFSTADGTFKVAIRGLFQADAAQYRQDSIAQSADRRSVKDLSSGVNVRRARIGLEGTVFKDWNWALTYEAGGSASESAGLQQVWVEYTGLKPFDLPLRIKGGVFAAVTGLEDATNNTDGVFVERAAIADLVRGISGGDGRNGVGAFINGERWNAELVWTGGLINTAAGTEFDEQSR